MECFSIGLIMGIVQNGSFAELSFFRDIILGPTAPLTNAITLWPLSISSWQTWEPINPAPPVTSEFSLYLTLNISAFLNPILWRKLATVNKM